MIPPTSKRLRNGGLAIVVVCALLYLISLRQLLPISHHGYLPGSNTPASSSNTDTPTADQDTQGAGAVTNLALPPDYDLHPTESEWCQQRYGEQFLFDARDWSVSYCTPGSASNFTCFHASTADNRVDSMCIGQRARFDAESGMFRLGCELRPLTDEERRRRVPSVPNGLHQYWYNTGPRDVLTKAVEFTDEDTAVQETPRRTTILLKREGAGNIWHCLMEIINLAWTLDILQISLDPQTGEPYLTPKDGETSQVVILDNDEDGPYGDLWRLFAKMPIRRLGDLGADEPPSDVVVPLAGGANTLWQGDWTALPCQSSPLVDAFVARVLRHHDTPTPEPGPKISVTFISRSGSRRLTDEDAHVAALRSAIPHADVVVHKLETMSFAEQLVLVRATDVLVGVHGAGLTHTMFLPPGRSAVVEILPESFEHVGFRNLAQMRDVRYYRSHAREAGSVPAAEVEGEGKGEGEGEGEGEEEEEGKERGQKREDGPQRRDWQQDVVEIDTDKLVDAVTAAVKGLYHTGLRTYDVS